MGGAPCVAVAASHNARISAVALERSVATRKSTKRWSQQVTEQSNALDLEEGVFMHDDPVEIARSLMRSAESSRRRKAPPFRSAMSMLVFYINLAGLKR